MTRIWFLSKSSYERRFMWTWNRRVVVWCTKRPNNCMSKIHDFLFIARQLICHPPVRYFKSFIWIFGTRKRLWFSVDRTLTTTTMMLNARRKLFWSLHNAHILLMKIIWRFGLNDIGTAQRSRFWFQGRLPKALATTAHFVEPFDEKIMPKNVNKATSVDFRACQCVASSVPACVYR